MRILFSTGSPARYMAPPRLAEKQINCGPDWFDRQSGGTLQSLSTPVGEYDLAAVAGRIPPDQKPDAVVCLVDASWRNLPRNLRAFRCPKVLLIADTHHLSQPLTRMIAYARSEPFDRIVLLYDRHHYEILRDAGVSSLYWFPGLTFPHEDARVAAARSEQRTTQLSFVGQLGICHPQRVQLLNCLCEQQLPLQVEAVPQAEALAFYGRSSIGFNASLNGDLNLRVFEILASGAMLLTDRLAPLAGLLDLWEEGRELLTYANRTELAERARYAIEHPAFAREVGQAGAAWFDLHFNASERRRAFSALVNDGIAPELFPLPAARSGPRPASGAPTPAALEAYEYLQELHRNTESVMVYQPSGGPSAFVEMVRTLPRIQLVDSSLDPPGRCDLAILSTASVAQGKLPAASAIWCWDAIEKDRVALVRRFAPLGLTLQPGKLFLFSRRHINTHQNHGQLALTLLEQGEYTSALNHAREELARQPQSVPALLALAELSQELGNESQALACLNRLKTIAPFDVRLNRLLSTPPENRKHRRCERLLKTGLAHLEQRSWEKAERCATEALGLRANWPDALRLLGRARCGRGATDAGLHHLHQALRQQPASADGWRDLGELLASNGRTADAVSAYLYATILDASHGETWTALADAAHAVGHVALANDAEQKARQVHAGLPVDLTLKPTEAPSSGAAVDLLVCHVEVTRLQGTGVLIKRFFPDSTGFVTLRSRTLYQGAVEFGSLSLSVDLPGLSPEARAQVVARLLQPLRIRRILSVPFFPSDFEHTIAAQELTHAPLCIYAMDDQTVYSPAVPEALARKAFAAAGLRLAISPEMVRDYTSRFAMPFGLLPPIVTNRADEVRNFWIPKTEITRRCVMVGNIWSAQQFAQLRAFLRAANVTVDWYGNSKVSWLPQDQAELERDGVFCRGFVPETVLAAKIAAYPFVLIPSGCLDGSEDNEWLTRLSLPSRMVFIVTKTRTPMLILGHPETAAARFVENLGLGLSSNYDPAEAADRIAVLTSAEKRQEWLSQADRATEAFVFPSCGEWIWSSLEARQPLPAPFDSVLVPAQPTLVNC